MPTIWVRKIDGGLDARRLPETTAGGALIKAEDGHLNRGGEFEKRAAFVPEYTLPAGTVSLAATADSLYVFGSAAAPAMPSGVLYQQLTHMSETLIAVPSYDLFAGKIYASAEFSDATRGHFYDGVAVTDWVDGRARATFQVTDGDSTPSTIDIEIAGVSIMSAPVSWTTSHADTATAIANEINSHTSSPDYEATAVGDTVIIVYPTATSGVNGSEVTFTLADGFAVNPDTGLTLAGGVATTFPEVGTFVKTIGSKMNVLAGSYLVFSGVADPTHYNGVTGSGFIDMSQEASGSEDLVALAEYQNLVAVLAERIIQIWNLAADPAGNAKQQTLRNTGTASPRSVTQFGDADVFYLDESGLRSLRARDSSNSASTSGIGVRVDPLIVAKLRSLTAAERAKVIGLVEPQDGRFWLIMKDTIYVFTYFPEEKISGWTTYTTHHYVDGVKTSFNVDDAAVFNRRVYLRSGNTVFCYGGISTGLTRDETEAEAWLPYLDGEDPTKEKTWQAFDVAVSGEWSVAVGASLRDTDEEDEIGVVFRTSYNDERIGTVGRSTHISPRFRSRGSGAAVLSACALHYADE